MTTCKDCLHYDICTFHITGNENERCCHFKNKADVVEVVRCKDCKHKVNFCGRIMCGRLMYRLSDGVGGLTATTSENFCSYGERKDDE